VAIEVSLPESGIAPTRAVSMLTAFGEAKRGFLDISRVEGNFPTESVEVISDLG
jgi:hypothetical protein